MAVARMAGLGMGGVARVAVHVAIPGIGGQAGNIVQFIESIVTHG
jgi:hypothetical protein